MKVPASDGTVLYARLIKPVGFQKRGQVSGNREVYGGPGVQVSQEYWRGADMAQVYAVYGYVVWQLDNRGSSGAGTRSKRRSFMIWATGGGGPASQECSA